VLARALLAERATAALEVAAGLHTWRAKVSGGGGRRGERIVPAGAARAESGCVPPGRRRGRR
jgi:hypothetical protein